MNGSLNSTNNICKRAGCESFDERLSEFDACSNQCRLPAPDAPELSDSDLDSLRTMCSFRGEQSPDCFDDTFLPAFGCGDTCIAQRRNLPARSLPCAGQTEATCAQTLAAPCTPEDLEPPPVASAAPPLCLQAPLRTAAVVVAVAAALLAL